MYRVYDKKKRRFIREEFYISPDGDLYIYKANLFGYRKLSLTPESRYVAQNGVGVTDINGVNIFEGDIIKSVSGIIGLVTYVKEKLSYVLLDYKEEKYYPLGEWICNQVKVIGNVFENLELLNGEETETDGEN